MKRVVCFGELMLRLSPNGQEQLFQSPQLRTWFGGSEANVAVSLAHFGVRSEFITRLPDNPIGDAAVQALRAEGVDVRRVVRGGPRMGIYFVEPGTDLRPMRVVYDRAGSSFSEIDADDVDWETVFRGADWFHVSGITPALGEGAAAAARAAIQAARAEHVKVSIDLNFRPALWTGRDPKPVIRPIAAACDLIIGNPGAVSAMLGIGDASASASWNGEDASAARAIAEQVSRELGCRQVALTRREVISASEHGWSAALYDAARDSFATSRRWQVRLVDRVGGGDSFAAALVHALLDGRDGPAALEFATAASALKLTIPGDANRVSASEVERLLVSAP